MLGATDNGLPAFAHGPILEALQLSPECVSTCVFRGINNDGVNLAEPKDVTLAMKMRQAISVSASASASCPCPEKIWCCVGQRFRCAAVPLVYVNLELAYSRVS